MQIWGVHTKVQAPWQPQGHPRLPPPVSETFQWFLRSPSSLPFKIGGVWEDTISKIIKNNLPLGFAYFARYLVFHGRFDYIQTRLFQIKNIIFANMSVFQHKHCFQSKKRCFEVREEVLIFSKHQKSLKSVQYSWRYVNFCTGVDNYCMWTRISCMMRHHDNHDASSSSKHVRP